MLTILDRGPFSPFYQERHKARKLAEVRPKTRKLVSQAITRANLDNERWPLFLHGGTGSGKTCIGLCLLDLYGGWYVELADLLSLITSVREGRYWFECINGSKAYEQELWNWWGRCSLTVLDELGVRERASDFAYEAVKRCLDRRENKPAVFISNLGPKKLAALYDDRIASRLCCGEVIEITGDRRTQKKEPLDASRT